jgi:outer membrane murein-binding lipoprotein Lpp
MDSLDNFSAAINRLADAISAMAAAMQSSQGGATQAQLDQLASIIAANTAKIDNLTK